MKRPLETPLRNGYSTGSCAAAAAQAALRHLLGETDCMAVDLTLPQGGHLTIPVARVWLSRTGAGAEVRKDAGDDPDATNGAAIVAEVKMHPGSGICIKGGTGVGRATKPGLAIKPGEPAINPVPRRMIQQAVKAFLPPDQGIEVMVSVPDGERLAQSTMNARLGIVGGISILGTSGLVRPMSLDAWMESLLPQLDQARAYNFDLLVLTPGGSGEKSAIGLGAPLEAIVQCSNFFDLMLKAVAERGFKAVVAIGQMGKMTKLAGGILDTHSRRSRNQVKILADLAFNAGLDREGIKRFHTAATIAEATSDLDIDQRRQLATLVAVQAGRQCHAFIQGRLEVGCIITDQKGRVLGVDDSARQLWRKLACKEL